MTCLYALEAHSKEQDMVSVRKTGIWALTAVLVLVAPFLTADPAKAYNIKMRRTDMPDITQKTNECGPTSTANSLRWLAKKSGFEEKLPKNNDDLIKDLMKAMTGSHNRPFPGRRMSTRR